MVEIPFAEGAPPDDLQVESVGDEVLVGDPDTDQVAETEDEFDENLAEILLPQAQVYEWLSPFHAEANLALNVFPLQLLSFADQLKDLL